MSRAPHQHSNLFLLHTSLTLEITAKQIYIHLQQRAQRANMVSYEGRGKHNKTNTYTHPETIYIQ